VFYIAKGVLRYIKNGKCSGSEHLCQSQNTDRTCPEHLTRPHERVMCSKNLQWWFITTWCWHAVT